MFMGYYLASDLSGRGLVSISSQGITKANRLCGLFAFLCVEVGQLSNKYLEIMDEKMNR